MPLSLLHRRGIIVLLGFLTALGPFTIDMYLPAFPGIARDLHTTASELALTLSSDFIGIALGQLCYGPLLDRFGRKKPLYIGLVIYAVASLLCIMSHSIGSMIFWRFILGAGGCVAGVAAYAVVRDLFAPEERATIFSMIMLVMGASPLLAPTVGNIVTLFIGWQAIFIILAIIALLLIAGSRWILPDTSIADTTVRLNPWHICKDYLGVAKTPAFYGYGLSGAFAFAALFAYIAGSPYLFFNFFHVSTTTYSLIFTFIAGGYISASQLNIWLLRHFKAESILQGALIVQSTLSLILTLMMFFHLLSLAMAVTLLFFILGSVGVVFPNAMMFAMIPFGHNTGRASAFISFAQMFFGTIASMSIGAFSGSSILPLGCIILIASLFALVIFPKEKGVSKS